MTAFLRTLPTCLRPGGRVAILSFHSGEDRRVKAAFKEGLRDGGYVSIADEVIRPTPRREAGQSPVVVGKAEVRGPRVRSFATINCPFHHLGRSVSDFPHISR